MSTPTKHEIIVCEKIDQLFNGRRLAEQCEQLSPYGVKPRLSDLKELQFSIYCLDKYFEHTWSLSQRRIDELWFNILSTLKKIIGNEQELEGLVRDIRAYQRLEESIRISPTLVLPQLTRYYHLKTCDVRLARNILVRGAVSFPEKTEYLKAWELFDLASEVCDDLDDIDEDIGTFNGNRFLLEIYSCGAKPAVYTYRKFELLLIQRITSLRKRVSSRHPASAVLDWASERLGDLKELLSIRVTNVIEIANGYGTSLLGTYRNRSSLLIKPHDLSELQPQSLYKEESPRIIL